MVVSWCANCRLPVSIVTPLLVVRTGECYGVLRLGFDRWSRVDVASICVGVQGRLFLEDMVPKNIATCLKAPKFLRFFFSHVKPNDTGKHEEYPFVSPCGPEMNFIKPADTVSGWAKKAADRLPPFLNVTSYPSPLPPHLACPACVCMTIVPATTRSPSYSRRWLTTEAR